MNQKRGPLHHHDDGWVPAQSLVNADADRLALNGHLQIQAVVGAAFAATRESHVVLAPIHDFRNGASEPLRVAADHLVDPGTGVVDPRFAFIFVHHVLSRNSSMRSAVFSIGLAPASSHSQSSPGR